MRLAPLLRRFFLQVAEEKEQWKGITLIIDFPEKLIPASEEANASSEERINLVTFLKWAAAPEMAHLDIGVLLVTESAAELQRAICCRTRTWPRCASICRTPRSGCGSCNPGWAEDHGAETSRFSEWSDFTPEELARAHRGSEPAPHPASAGRSDPQWRRASRNEHVTASKKRLIEEYCQGLVRFKDPKPGVSLDRVATHAAAKKQAARAGLADQERQDRRARARHPGARPRRRRQIVPHRLLCQRVRTAGDGDGRFPLQMGGRHRTPADPAS